MDLNEIKRDYPVMSAQRCLEAMRWLIAQLEAAQTELAMNEQRHTGAHRLNGQRISDLESQLEVVRKDVEIIRRQHESAVEDHLAAIRRENKAERERDEARESWKKQECRHHGMLETHLEQHRERAEKAEQSLTETTAELARVRGENVRLQTKIKTVRFVNED